MPRLSENTERQLHDLENGARARTLKAWDSFSNFALRDNVLEVAVGLMYALQTHFIDIAKNSPVSPLHSPPVQIHSSPTSSSPSSHSYPS